MNLNDLGNNLQNMYSASYNTELTADRFVPNLSGTLIYDASRGMGRFWRIFYQVVCFFIGQDFKLIRLQAAVQKTHQIFQEQLKNITPHMERFQKYLGEICEGGNVVETNMQETLKAITEWNDATHPFLKLVRRKKRVLIELLQRCLGKNEKNPVIGEEFFQTELFPRSGCYQDIIDLEGELAEQIPWHLLRKAATNITINVDEDVEIRQWILKLNLYAAENPERRALIHRAFQSFLKHVKENHASRFIAEPHLGTLASALIDLDCRLFAFRDPKHIEWREKMEKDSVLNCNGKKIVLGEPIGRKLHGEDNVLIFQIKDDPEHVVAFGINRATLALRQKWLLEENAWSIKVAAMRELDEYGRFAIIEKLRDPRGGQPWMSVSPHLSAEDMHRCRPLVSFVDCCIRRNCTPVAFSPQHVLLDKMGRIAYAKILALPSSPQRQFNFNALEDFVFKASLENPMVFSFLMKESRLTQHRFAGFYQTLVQDALNGTEVNVETRYHVCELHDISMLAQGKKLYEEALQLNGRCLEKIRTNHPLRLAKTLDAAVREQLTRRYNESCAAGILWPTLENDVVQALA